MMAVFWSPILIDDILFLFFIFYFILFFLNQILDKGPGQCDIVFMSRIFKQYSTVYNCDDWNNLFSSKAGLYSTVHFLGSVQLNCIVHVYTFLPGIIVAQYTQWFQSSILLVDIATTRLNQPRGRFSENHLKCITRWEGRDGVTITSFSSIHVMKTRPSLCKKDTTIYIWSKQNYVQAPLIRVYRGMRASRSTQKWKLTQNWLL